jgi:hypothetical protein
LSYKYFAIVILDSSGSKGLRLDLNIKVRDLRDIPPFVVILKKSLKNFAGGACRAYSATEGAFGSLASI